MCKRFRRRRGKPNCGPSSDEGHVEPEREPVDGARLQDVELEGNLDAVQLSLVRRLKVDDVALRLGKADADVKSVHLKQRGF
jgi:hypothetical protein